MVNYQDGRIYQITSAHTDKVYIGSTCQALSNRMAKHRACYKRYLDGKNNYITSFEILQYDDAQIELVEYYPCDTKEALYKKEADVIRATANSVNKVIPARTVAEYRQDNKEDIAKQKKAYREEHREEIAKKWKHTENNTKIKREHTN